MPTARADAFDMDRLDPELRRVARMMRLLTGGLSDTKLRRMRRFMGLQRRLPAPRSLRTWEQWVQRPDGTRLRLRLYAPRVAGSAPAPGLLWLHGGGYILGTPEQEVGFIQPLVAASGCVVVAPDYRLAPDHRYPAAVEDAHLALRWLRDHAADLGVREDQLAVGGESAGGGLTAALTLLARDRGEVAVAFQMPLYPMIDDREITPSSRDNHAPVWDTAANRFGWRAYLGDRVGTEAVPPYAAPARATDLAGLPPTLTYVGDLEPFRDETVAYVAALRAAGVPVAFREFARCCHGFDAVAPNAAVSREARAFQIEWFRDAIARHTAPQLPRPGPRT